MSLKTVFKIADDAFVEDPQKEIQFSSLTSNTSTDVNSLTGTQNLKQFQIKQKLKTQNKIERNYSEGDQGPNKPIIIKSKFLKSISNQKHNSVFVQQEEEQRKDRFGNLILKGSKQHHISVGVGEIIEVESYKKFNENMTKTKLEDDDDSKCQNICKIF